LNSSRGYYNDICYTTTSDSGTDISLNDRKKEFVEQNKTICQDNCFLAEYNYITQIANCSCKVKAASSFFKEMKIDKVALYENFVNFKNIANIKYLKSYKYLFCKIGLIQNIGSYIIDSIFIFHIIFIFIFIKIK